MFRNVMLAVITGLAFSGTAAAQDVLTPEQAIPGEYIVVFDDAQVTRTQVAAQAQALARQHGGRIRYVYEEGLRGFAASMEDATPGRGASSSCVPCVWARAR